MGRAYLIFIVAVGLLSSMLNNCAFGAPASNKAGYDAASANLDSRLSHSDGDEEASASSGAVELRRESNGHFYADVQINGMPIRVLVDTGATGIALSRSDARRAGLAVSAGMFDVVGEGANGDVRGEFVTLDKVELGSARANSVPAVVLDAGEQSLLGQSFLSEFDSVEIRGDTMVLR